MKKIPLKSNTKKATTPKIKVAATKNEAKAASKKVMQQYCVAFQKLANC